MVDSTHLCDRPGELMSVLQRDGYVLLRNVLNRDKVVAARRVVVEALDSEWRRIDKIRGDSLEAHVLGDAKGILLTGFRNVTKHKDVTALLEGPELCAFFRRLFGSAPATFDNKWVRVHGKGEATDEHTDFFRFAGNANGMFTCWLPLGDYNIAQGALAVCEASHLLKGFTDGAYSTETKVELPRDFEKFKETATWRSTTFRAGDVVVFDIRLVHASTENTTTRFRISMDTRWQPAKFVSKDAADGFRSFLSSD